MNAPAVYEEACEGLSNDQVGMLHAYLIGWITEGLRVEGTVTCASFRLGCESARETVLRPAAVAG